MEEANPVETAWPGGKSAVQDTPTSAATRREKAMRFSTTRIVILVVLLASAISFLGTQHGRAATEKTSTTTVTHAIAREVKLTTGKFEGGQKLCSSIWPGHFRDTVPMPPAAGGDACRSWMNITGGTTYQQGCMFSSGAVSMGPVGGGVPTPNCGW